MNAKEYGAWISDKNRNGRRPPDDVYNRSFKKERPEQPKEYAGMDRDEYHSYPEVVDERSKQDNKKDNDKSNSSSKKDSKSSNSASKAQNSISRVTQVVTRVVAASVSTVVIANGYQAMGGELPFELPITIIPVAVETTENVPSETTGNVPVETTDNQEQTETISEVLTEKWVWNEDNTKATLQLFDGKGVLVTEIPADINVSKIEATCVAGGTSEYTASAEYNGKAYTESRKEKTEPSGHTFDEGKTVVLEDGQTAIVFECIHCHEQFTVVISVEED